MTVNQDKEMKSNSLGNLYDKWIGRLIPRYGVLSLIGCLLLNNVIYFGIQLCMKNVRHYDFTTDLDRAVPFVKEWIIIYLGCYLFWGLNYILTTREGKENWYRFATADMLSRLVCGLFFILLPTTNIRPEVAGNDIFSVLTRYMYSHDDPVNLFPSIHCLVSWFCFIGIRKSKKIPLWYKVVSCILAILVCISTQYVKQHYLIDIAGGIVLAELCYYIMNHTNIYRKVESFYDKLDQFLFNRRYHE